MLFFILLVAILAGVFIFMKCVLLEYRLENMEDDVIGAESLFKDVIAFNMPINNARKYSKSLLLNWFINKRLAEIEPINMESYLESALCK